MDTDELLAGDIENEEVQSAIEQAQSDSDGDDESASASQARAVATADETEADTRDTDPSPGLPLPPHEALGMAHTATDDDANQACLADPRLISTEDEFADLRRYLTETIIGARDAALTALADEAGNSASLAADRNTDRLSQRLIRAARRAIDQFLARESVDESIRGIHRSVYDKTIGQLTSDTHTDTIDTYAVTVGAAPDESAIDYYVTNTGNQIDDLADELLVDMRTQLRRGLEADRSMDQIRAAIEADLSDEYLRSRAQLIARQETQFVSQGIRYRAYENDSNVMAVRPINPCSDSTTRLCEHLAGCGPREEATAVFDHPDGLSIGEQLQEHAPAGTLFAQFDPMPDHPPFHFNCRTELIPVLDTDGDN